MEEKPINAVITINPFNRRVKVEIEGHKPIHFSFEEDDQWDAFKLGDDTYDIHYYVEELQDESRVIDCSIYPVVDGTTQTNDWLEKEIILIGSWKDKFTLMESN